MDFWNSWKRTVSVTLMVTFCLATSVTVFLLLPSKDSALRWISSTVACLVCMVVVLCAKLYILHRKTSTITPSISTRQVRPRLPQRLEFLRTPSLPSYENAMSEQGTKGDETPPPTYYEIHLPAWI